ncbi:hypothetical protein [Mycoplasma struthionis]|uniref:Lipoprotein n=1 Tax=Mycoplasma struthionis TaxID=538220 RepID=A0A3G8LIK9_9MOLU|nr:hypothetical protein [Mycoplasma struthionis]AZG68498.1 hypothetical protein EGN60_00720 [Mycoplasma struthionis]
MNFKKLILSNFLLISIPLTVLSCENKSSNSALTISDYEKLKKYSITETRHLNYDRFFKLATYLANDESPSIYFSRNAGQFYNTSFYLLSLELSKLKEHVNKKILYLMNEEVYNPENSISRFNFENILNEYGDILKTEDGQLGIVSNTKYLTNNKTDISYANFVDSKHELEQYINYLALNNNKKANVIMCDISFDDLDDATRNKLFKVAKKIILLPDGNAQPFKFINNDYLNWVKTEKDVLSEEQIQKQFIEFVNSDKETLDMNYHNLYRLKNYIEIYNIDGRYIDFFNNEIENLNKSEYKIDVYDFPINVNKSYLDKGYNFDFNKVISLYDDINKLSNKSLLELLDKPQEYDKNKKNLIYLGSSLFTKYTSLADQGKYRVEYNLEASKEIEEYFDKLMELYPPQEYNYLFKLHPVYKGEEAKIYLSKLTKNKVPNPILIDSSVSWENILMKEYEKLKTNESILFDKNDFKNNNSKTVLTGLQATSTTLLSTYTFLVSEFNIDLKKSYAFLNPKNFPISNKFNLVFRDKNLGNDLKMYNENKKLMINVLAYYMLSNVFPSLDEFISTNEFLKREN